MNNELEYFKSKVSLVSYAQNVGFSVDKRDSTKSSIKLRRNSEIIIVSKSNNNHDVYFSPTDNSKGSIIDFVINQKRCSLNEARNELRVFSNSPISNERVYSPVVKVTNLAMVKENYSKTLPVNYHKYLERRGITKETLSKDRFKDKVRIDNANNLIFPHYSNKELTGYEIKSATVKRFSSGGEKGLWASNNIKEANKIVIVEGVIDALSYEVLKGDEKTAYLSSGGQINNKQLDLIKEISNKYPAKIVVATDNDEVGNKLHEVIEKAIGSEKCVRELPKNKDWNEDLMSDLGLNKNVVKPKRTMDISR